MSCAAAVLTRWRLSTGTLVAVLGGGQVLLHQALSALSVSPCAEVVARPSGHAGHSGAALAVRSCPVPDAAAHHAVASSVPSMAMLAAHVAATVVIAVVLARGERLVWDLWVSLTPLVALLLLRVALPSRQMRTTPTHQLPSPRPVRVPGAPRRGPPARLRAAAALGA